MSVTILVGLTTALSSQNGVCHCENATLCKPISTAPAKREVFAFFDSNNTWSSLDFSTMTTACAFTQVDPALVCHAHKLGVRVVKSAPFDVKHIKNSTARTAWVQAQLASVQSAGLDGLNIDIEGYKGAPGPLTALVGELYSALKKWHPESQLSFDLSIFPDGQSRYYDHRALAEVLDFIVPMAYDEPWGTKVAAANSPIRNIGAGVSQYVKMGVPASKLVIGLPWYGWDYPCAAKEGPCVVKPPDSTPWFGWATQVGYSDEMHLLHAEGGPITMDTTSVTKHFDYTASSGKSPGRHQLWYDDPETLQQKYAACKNAGARGLAFWTADMPNYTNNEGTQMWAAINKGFPHLAKLRSPDIASADFAALSLTEAKPFSVVGWYLAGPNGNTSGYPLEQIRWDVYSTIQLAGIKVNHTTGKASCPDDPLFIQGRAVARKHGKQIQLGSGVDAWQYISNAMQGYKNQTINNFFDSYMATLGTAVRACGDGVISGIEFDFEGHALSVFGPGAFSKQEAHFFSVLMNKMQKAMGDNYTVSCDVGVVGTDWAPTGGSYAFETKWIDTAIFKANPNLFINTMSYHDPRDCSIAAWKKNAQQMEEKWGLSRQQINLGIGYFTFNHTNGFPPKLLGEPSWASLSKRCPNISYDECVCDGISFTSKKMNHDIAQFVREGGYRGLFPWAASYDVWGNDANNLAKWVGKGLGYM